MGKLGWASEMVVHQIIKINTGKTKVLLQVSLSTVRVSTKFASSLRFLNLFKP